MNIRDLRTSLNLGKVGRDMYQLIEDLYPICRSITGNGVRDTLHLIGKHIPIEVHEVPSGLQVFDWTVPREWNIEDAYIKNSHGEKIIDFKACNLHVVNYSTPIKRKMSLHELKKHLFTLPEHPAWIPFRTSYYHENWGFCLSHQQLLSLHDDEYEVCIDSRLTDGSLTYGEYVLNGEVADEVLLTCNICHPSMCNDTLSAVAFVVFIAKHLKALSLRYSYRFLFAPATIGPITWLYLNEHQVQRIKHGLVIACVGDAGKSTYKKSRRGDAEVDRAVARVFNASGQAYAIMDFFPYGYDERQFCSPGFDLPVGCLMRTPHGQFPEYHTSADNLEFVQPRYLADSFAKGLDILSVLEHNRVYTNLNPKCEPHLGKRGLYRTVGGSDVEVANLAMFWVLNMSDGRHSLLDIAERSGLAFDLISEAAQGLLERGLLKEKTD